MRPVTTALAIVLLAAGYTGAQSVCPGNGALTLATTGGRLGDPFSLTLSGTPNVSGLLGFDLAGGPVITALGNVCLGLSPAMQLQSFTLDPAGGFGIAGLVPPSPPLAGLSVFMQAAANDATQPSGFALSNATRADLRPPHLHFVIPANGPPGPGGTLPPGLWVPYDILTDSILANVNLPSNVVDQVVVRPLGWLAFLLGTPRWPSTTRRRWRTSSRSPLPPPTTAWTTLGVSGTTLVVLDPGSAGALGTLRAYSLQLGTLLWSTSVPGNPSAMIVPPGTSALYVSYGGSVIPVLLATGALLPPISLGAGAADVEGVGLQWRLRLLPHDRNRRGVLAERDRHDVAERGLRNGGAPARRPGSRTCCASVPDPPARRSSCTTRISRAAPSSRSRRRLSPRRRRPFRSSA